MVATPANFLRYASPNEMRTIVREEAGYYYSVIIGAVYEFEDGFDVKSPRSYYQPLTRCIEEHPFFSAIVADVSTNKAYYQRVSSVDLEKHVSIVEDPAAAAEPLKAIGDLASREMEVPCFKDLPPWRIIVLPLQASQAFVGFAFSHQIGDGPAGLSFHRTFLAGLRETPSDEPSSIVVPPKNPLPLPFDTPERLPISWSFLLQPFIAQFMPPFIIKLLGLRVSAAHTNEGTFTGPNMFFDPKTELTKLEIREIEAPVVAKTLQAARQHDAKLTGTMQNVIARALSQAYPDPKITNFVCATATDMRRSIGVSENIGGLFVSGTHVMYPRVDSFTGPLTEEEWESASSSTREFARAASQLQDQAVGLLRYASSVRNWVMGQIGRVRDASFGMSNLGSFDAGAIGPGDNEGRAKITKVMFAQPGTVQSPPITFNVVGIRGGSIVYTVTWQPGALGLEAGRDEEKVVKQICDQVDEGMRNLV